MERKMNYQYQWKVSDYRRDRRTGVGNPIKRSDYVQQLFKGAEWNEQKAVGESDLPVSLEEEGARPD
ncbi:hypothetical protein [Virgibacillus sediminis]|uniref:Transposase n=1 Tax=Virgibacillus sediminis TaxID=202260 RepID=A0ABV7A6K6_9BACI